MNPTTAPDDGQGSVALPEVFDQVEPFLGRELLNVDGGRTRDSMIRPSDCAAKAPRGSPGSQWRPSPKEREVGRRSDVSRLLRRLRNVDQFERDLGAIFGVQFLVVLQQQLEEGVAAEQADVALGRGEVAGLLWERCQRDEEAGALVAHRSGALVHIRRPDVAVAALDLHPDDRRVKTQFVRERDDVDTPIRSLRRHARAIDRGLEQVADQVGEAMVLEVLRERLEQIVLGRLLDVLTRLGRVWATTIRSAGGVEGAAQVRCGQSAY